MARELDTEQERIVVGLVRISTFHPLLDERLSEFVERHTNTSVFNTIGWPTALQTTYGYEPVAITTSSPSEKLTNVLLFCVVRSWVTGDRVV